MTLEDELRSTLGHAAERAPYAPPGLPAHIVTRSRRRRTRTTALAAAAMVVVIAGGATLALRGGEDRAAPPVPATRPTPAPIATPDLVENVWPEAVWKIPDKLEGGGKIRPLSFIDDRTVLFRTWESHEKTNAIYAYDLEAGRSRKITGIRTPNGVYASGFVVGRGRIFWNTIEGKGTTFWSVPIEGGTPERLDAGDDYIAPVDQLAVVGERLAFSLVKGGVFTLPIGGGEVTAVPGAERHHILSWPWVGTPGDYTPNNETSFEELLNVETGAVSKAVVHPDEQQVRCEVTACVGIRPDQSAFFRLRDGSQERDLLESQIVAPASGRFLSYWLTGPDGGQVLVDLLTGTSGDLGLRRNAKGESASVHPGMFDDRLVSYPLKDQRVIIDLSKIK